MKDSSEFYPEVNVAFLVNHTSLQRVIIDQSCRYVLLIKSSLNLSCDKIQRFLRIYEIKTHTVPSCLTDATLTREMKLP